MKSRVIVVAAILALGACGKDEPAKKTNNALADASSDMMATTDMSVGDTSVSDTSVGDGGSGPDAGGDASTLPDGGGSDMSTACGNGVLDAPEECDDGALNDDQGNGTCRTTCLVAYCGDNVVDWRAQETCDDGNTTPGDGCDAQCIREVAATCGDGAMTGAEMCDDGARNSDANPDACRSDCTLPACGDAVADRGEECDDGNVRSGDGCASDCTAEVGASCGDGTLDVTAREECDDGNVAAGDGCSSTCQFEPSSLTCGDGTVDARELCDDSNTANGDGCNPTCNSKGEVTTLLGNVTGQGALTADRDRLWLAQDFRIGYVLLDAACLTQNNCALTPAAGTGVQGHVDAADGATAQLGFSESLATDGATVWFFDERTLRAMSTTPPYAVTTVAGDVTSAPDNCDVVDGVGAAARFYGTRGLTYYNGVLYFLDGCTGLLRQFDPTTAEVLTIAGTEWVPSNPASPMCPSGGGGGYSCNAGAAADGFGFSGAMVSPRYMASDNAGMLFITDTNGETLRTYNTVTGYLGTLAGGTQGYNDAIGTAARLDRPRGLTSDGTSLYWSEQNQHTVRQVVVSTASVTTLAGQRGCAGSADGTGGTGQTSGCMPMGQAQFDTPFSVVYHFPSRSLYLRDANGLRRVE